MKPVTNRLLPVLQASMEIRTATKVNGWLYFIKKLPIVGKRIPDRVYRWQTLKTVLAYITLPARFIGLWFGKALCRPGRICSLSIWWRSARMPSASSRC